MYKYPYGDSQQLNLDWIISKIKELEARGSGGGSGGAADLETVSNALISLTYNTSTAYRRYDYAFLNGKLYRCINNTSGVFNPTAWQEALIGDDLAILTRWINTINAAAVVDVKFDTSGTNGKIQQKYNDQYHDVVEVDYTPVQNSKRPLSSNAGYELNGAINKMGAISANTKALLIGDSYNYGVGGTSGRGWSYYLQQMTGCTATIVHQNGGGFAAVGNSNADYPNMTYAQLVSSISATDYDVVIAQSGWNDASTGRNPNGVTAIVSGVNSFISAAKTKFSKAKIIIVPTYSATVQNLYQESCLNAIANTAISHGIKTSKSSRFWQQGVSFTADDGIHLTDDGYQLLAQQILSFINGWSGEQSGVVAQVPTTPNPAPTNITASSIENFKFDNNTAIIKCDVTLTETLSSWTTVLENLVPYGPLSTATDYIVTMTNWNSTFKRNIRVGVSTEGKLNVRYGEAGSYRISFVYPTKIVW